MLLRAGPCPHAQGRGAGAGDCDISHEIFACSNTSSAGLIVDRVAPPSEQQSVLARALETLKARGEQRGADERRCMCMEDIDFDTEKLDSWCGNDVVQMALNHYW